MIIPDEFWQEIERFENKVILVSGGKDSTVTALAFFKRKIPCYYLHNDTGLIMPESRTTLNKLYELTKENVIDFIKIKSQDYLDYRVNKNTSFAFPKVKDVLHYSFTKVHQIHAIIENGGEYDRNVFKCCNYLKKNPTKWFLSSNKNLFPSESTVFITSLSIQKRESSNRKIRLAQIRKLNTFLRFHKSKGYWYGYPLRDHSSEKEINQYLSTNGFSDTISSGCVICPVLLLFRLFNEDPKRYLLSKKYFMKHFQNVKFCGKLDHALEDYEQFQEVTL